MGKKKYVYRPELVTVECNQQSSCLVRETQSGSILTIKAYSVWAITIP